jgi:hypothetical protein
MQQTRIVLIFSALLLLSAAPFSSYSSKKAFIEHRRQSFQQQNSSTSLAEAGKFLHRNIVDSLIPHWYGTPWNFSGTSEIPGKGTIACSYFTSTVLRDVGFQLNRYKLSQLHSFDEVAQFCGNPKILNDSDSLRSYMNAQTDGLYLIGLDNHIGFLNKEMGNCWFIHSNYLIPACVVKEKLFESQAILSSNQYHVGAITNNKKVLEMWLQKKTFVFK